MLFCYSGSCPQHLTGGGLGSTSPLYLHGRDAGTCLGVVLREKLVLGLFSKQVRDFGLTACVREARGGNLCK